MKGQYERNCHELLSAVFFFLNVWFSSDVSQDYSSAGLGRMFLKVLKVFFFSSLISQDYQATQAAGQTVALPSLLPLYAPCFKAAMWWQCCCGQTSVPGAVLSLCCESLSWTTSSARPCGSELVWPPLIIYQLSRNRSEEQPALSN